MLSQISEHAAFGGVVPEIAARAHVEALDRIIAKAMMEAGKRSASIDGIAAAAGPGLIGGVIVGLTTAKAIALVNDKPLIAVNHLEAHALTARLTRRHRRFPIACSSPPAATPRSSRCAASAITSRLGTTLDDAIGEAFDKTAKLLGLGYPGGPQVEKEARARQRRRASRCRGRCRAAPSRLLALGAEDRAAARGRDDRAADATRTSPICAPRSSRRSVDVVHDRLRAGLKHVPQRYGTPTALVAAGGVAANRGDPQGAAPGRVRGTASMLVVPPRELCTDNGAMIAWAGAERLALGLTDPLDFAPRARWPLEEIAGPKTQPGTDVAAGA